MEAFNNNKDGLFKKIDNFFKTRKQSEQNVIYMMVALLIGYMVYQFVFFQTDMRRNQAFNKVSSMQKKVNQKRFYLSRNSPQKLQQMKMLVKNRRKDYDNILYKISYVDNTLNELSYLLFNDENWAKFVDNISYLAKRYGLEIKEITNKFFKPTFQKISQVVTIEVKTKSNYQDMMKFLNKIEESKLVVDVSDMNITKPDNKLSSYFKISVWGMKY
jgi:Tfp pilus assembly protein PilO